MKFGWYEARFLPLNKYLTILTFHNCVFTFRKNLNCEKNVGYLFFLLKSVHFLNFAIFCEIC